MSWDMKHNDIKSYPSHACDIEESRRKQKITPGRVVLVNFGLHVINKMDASIAVVRVDNHSFSIPHPSEPVVAVQVKEFKNFFPDKSSFLTAGYPVSLVFASLEERDRFHKQALRLRPTRPSLSAVVRPTSDPFAHLHHMHAYGDTTSGQAIQFRRLARLLSTVSKDSTARRNGQETLSQIKLGLELTTKALQTTTAIGACLEKTSAAHVPAHVGAVLKAAITLHKAQNLWLERLEPYLSAIVDTGDTSTGNIKIMMNVGRRLWLVMSVHAWQLSTLGTFALQPPADKLLTRAIAAVTGLFHAYLASTNPFSATALVVPFANELVAASADLITTATSDQHIEGPAREAVVKLAQVVTTLHGAHRRYGAYAQQPSELERTFFESHCFHVSAVLIDTLRALKDDQQLWSKCNILGFVERALQWPEQATHIAQHLRAVSQAQRQGHGSQHPTPYRKFSRAPQPLPTDAASHDSSSGRSPAPPHRPHSISVVPGSTHQRQGGNDMSQQTSVSHSQSQSSLPAVSKTQSLRPGRNALHLSKSAALPFVMEDQEAETDVPPAYSVEDPYADLFAFRRGGDGDLVGDMDQDGNHDGDDDQGAEEDGADDEDNEEDNLDMDDGRDSLYFVVWNRKFLGKCQANLEELSRMLRALSRASIPKQALGDIIQGILGLSDQFVSVNAVHTKKEAKWRGLVENLYSTVSKLFSTFETACTAYGANDELLTSDPAIATMIKVCGECIHKKCPALNVELEDMLVEQERYRALAIQSPPEDGQYDYIDGKDAVKKSVIYLDVNIGESNTSGVANPGKGGSTGGKVQCATIEKIVERITRPTNQDGTLLPICVLTYHTFSSLSRLLDVLAERYESADATNPRDKASFIKVQVLNIIKQLVLLNGEEFRLEDNANKLRTFLKACADEFGHASSTIANLEDYLAFEHRNASLLFTPDGTHVTPPFKPLRFSLDDEDGFGDSDGGDEDDAVLGSDASSGRRRRGPHVSRPRLTITSLDAKTFAQQLSLIALDRMRQLTPFDLVGDGAAQSAVMKELVDLHCDVTNWVIGSLLQASDLKERAKVLKKFILLAEALWKLGNMELFVAVYAGYTHSSIVRLKKTWAMLKGKAKRLSAAHEAAYQEGKMTGVQEREEHLLESAVPYIPVIALLKKKLAYAKTIEAPDATADMIPLQRREAMYHVIQMVRHCQQHLYRFPPNIPLLTLIRSNVMGQPLLQGGEAADRSLRLEPRAQSSAQSSV